MSEQALDLRGSLRIVRRHKILVSIVTALGILAGAGYAVLNPSTLSSNALVALPPTTRDTGTQVVIASSDHVLVSASHTLHPTMSLQTLRSRVRVKSLTSNLLSVDAYGKTAAQAEDTANAVANSYIAYVRTAHSAAGKVQAQLLESATNATGTPLARRLSIWGGLGALLGLLIGVIIALALNRNDRRLRHRDEIANAIGVPVLASVSVGHLSDAASWARLLENYEPSVVHAWQWRNALLYLGLGDFKADSGINGSSLSVAVLSLSSDRDALAIGPQLAVFASSAGIPTALVIVAQPDMSATDALCIACTRQRLSSAGPSQLQVIVAQNDALTWQKSPAKLTVIVNVVDDRQPRPAKIMRATSTVLAVTAGSATAAQLVGVAVGVAGDGRQVDGIFVADPDPDDRTTGRVPQLTRPAHRRMPTRLTDSVSETRP